MLFTPHIWRKYFVVIGIVMLMVTLPVTTIHSAGLSLLRDAETEYTLKTFSKPIFEQAGLSPETVRFFIVNNSTLNAFVAGGQNIFFHTGLLLQTKTPDELIGVIAHESGHIADGHIFRTQSVMEDYAMQATLANILGAAIAIGGGGNAGMAAGALGTTLATRLAYRHSRIQETAADQAGLRYLKDSQLPIKGFLSFMETLADQEFLPEDRQSEYVRTHPLSSDRVRFLRHAAENANYTAKMPPQWIEAHARMRAKLQGYLYPNQALSIKSDTIAARYGRAIALYRKGRMQDAINEMNALIAVEPENPFFHEQLGQILYEDAQTHAAVKAYKKAVQLAPKEDLIRAAYGRALMDTNQLEEAKKQYTQVLSHNDKDINAHHFIAMTYGKMGNEAMSRLHLAEVALATGRLDQAEIEVTRALGKLSKSTPAYQRAMDIRDVIKQRKENKKR